MLRTLLTTALIGLTACNASMQSEAAPGDVTLDVEPWTASAGDSVTLTLRNTLSETVGYNLCTSSLERRVGYDWQAVPSERACTMELRTLGPDDQASYVIRLEPTTQAGEYRFRTAVTRMESEGRLDAVSDTFTVRP